MRREHCYYVYMVQSASRRTVYIGMTSKLIQRVFQHKTHEFEGFTDSYNALRLVYWESFDDVHKATTRFPSQLQADAGSPRLRSGQAPRLHRITRFANDSVPLGMTE